MLLIEQLLAKSSGSAVSVYNLYLWGNNDYGQVGNGLALNNENPVAFPTDKTWAVLSNADVPYTLAITTGGQLWGWGYNSDGNIGDNSSLHRSSPVQIGTLTTWSKAAAGAYSQSLAIKTDGTLWAWGNNAYGQLGNGTTGANVSSPIQIGALTTWSKVAAAIASHAIKTDGTLWGWGINTDGQIGDGTVDFRSSPVQVGALTNWSKISEYQAVAAIKTDGTLWTWGQGDGGQLGTNTAGNIYRSSPVQVGTLTDWAEVAVGNSFMIALKTNGTLWAWGQNNGGQLGDGTTINKSSPVQIGTLTTWSKIGASFAGTGYAIKTDGTLWAWGQNGSFGHLGDGTIISKSSPVQIGTLTNWSSVYGGNTCAFAINTSNYLYGWGGGANGRLGLNYSDVLSPVFIGSYAAASSSVNNTLAISQNGALYGWGHNSAGQLGNNTTSQSLTPLQVGSSLDWASVSTGSGAQTLAIKTDGTLWAWGQNNNGQLGDNTTINKSSPVQIGILTNWSKISAGDAISFAIKTDGTLWSWGRNASGQLGDNTVVSKSSPVQIGTLTNWAQVAAGYDTGYAIKTDGTLWAWGSNNRGQIGNNTNINASSPVQVGTLTNWSKIASGSYAALAVKTDGTLWAWGYNLFGTVGDGTIIHRSSPVQIGALTTWSDVFAGYESSYAVKTDGTLWAWGYNLSGQLGIDVQGSTQNRSSPVQIGSLSTWTSVNAMGVGSRNGAAFST